MCSAQCVYVCVDSQRMCDGFECWLVALTRRYQFHRLRRTSLLATFHITPHTCPRPHSEDDCEK